MKSIKAIGMCVFLVFNAGCATQSVAAWQKGELAKPAMSLKTNQLENRFAKHSYDSREAAHGGGGVGGGGCGCN